MSGRLYFAYGSNMDTAQMAARCPAARRVGTGSVAGMRFLINTRGVATVVPARGARVHGVLWRLTPECERALDGFEGVVWGRYRKRVVAVETRRGTLPALAYVDPLAIPGLPRPGYLELVLRAAARARLPRDGFARYLAWLARRAA